MGITCTGHRLFTQQDFTNALGTAAVTGNYALQVFFIHQVLSVGLVGRKSNLAFDVGERNHLEVFEMQH